MADVSARLTPDFSISVLWIPWAGWHFIVGVFLQDCWQLPWALLGFSQQCPVLLLLMTTKKFQVLIGGCRLSPRWESLDWLTCISSLYSLWGFKMSPNSSEALENQAMSTKSRIWVKVMRGMFGSAVRVPMSHAEVPGGSQFQLPANADWEAVVMAHLGVSITHSETWIELLPSAQCRGLSGHLFSELRNGSSIWCCLKPKTFKKLRNRVTWISVFLYFHGMWDSL